MCRVDIESVVRRGGGGASTKSKLAKKHAKESSKASGSGGKSAAKAATGSSSAGASELPYGGDMQKAMQAQDRDAIRKIMAARQGGGASAASEEGGSSGGGAAAPSPKADLPYGGDMQAAMKAQDRDAIRQIMAARDASKQ